jgi:transcriptional regulator with XRE-family HTH domain
VNTINDRIKERRLELGMSQAGLAKKSGLSAGAIGNYESGTREPKKTREIANSLGVSREWLETGKGSKEIKKAPINHGALSAIETEALSVFRLLPNDNERHLAIETMRIRVNDLSDSRNHTASKKDEAA